MHGRLDRKRFLTTLGAAGVGFGLTAASGAPAALAHPRPPEGPMSSPPEPGHLDERMQLHAAFYTAFTAALAEQLGSMAPVGVAPAAGGEARGSQNQAGPGADQHGGSANSSETAANSAAAAVAGKGHGGREREKPSGSQGGQDMGQSGESQTGAPSGERGASASASPAGGPPSGADAVDAAIRQALMALIDARQTQAGLSYGQAEALKTIVATSLAPLAPEPPGLAWLIAAHGGGATGPAASGGQPSGSERETGGQERAHAAAGAGGLSGASHAGAQAGNQPATASGAKAHNGWRGGWP